MEGQKYDSDRTRFDLLPFGALEEIAKVLTFGAKKYDDDNWRKVPNLRRRYLAACLRHVWAWRKGERNDPETGLHHLAHAGCCLLFVLSTELGVDPEFGNVCEPESAPFRPLLGDTICIQDLIGFEGVQATVKVTYSCGDIYVQTTNGLMLLLQPDQYGPVTSGAV